MLFKSLSNSMRNFLILAFLLGILFSVNNYAKKEIREIRLWTTKGSVYNVNTENELKVSSQLPLVSFQALDVNSDPIDPASEFSSNDLFFSTKEKVVKREVAVTSTPKKIMINYQNLLNNSVKVASLSKNGAIINNRYYSKGQSINGLDIYNEEGERVNIKLAKVDIKRHQVAFSLLSKYYYVEIQ